jgi:hypothetical protein
MTLISTQLFSALLTFSIRNQLNSQRVTRVGVHRLHSNTEGDRHQQVCNFTWGRAALRRLGLAAGERFHRGNAAGKL